MLKETPLFSVAPHSLFTFLLTNGGNGGGAAGPSAALRLGEVRGLLHGAVNSIVEVSAHLRRVAKERQEVLGGGKRRPLGERAAAGVRRLRNVGDDALVGDADGGDGGEAGLLGERRVDAVEALVEAARDDDGDFVEADGGAGAGLLRVNLDGGGAVGVHRHLRARELHNFQRGEDAGGGGGEQIAAAALQNVDVGVEFIGEAVTEVKALVE